MKLYSCGRNYESKYEIGDIVRYIGPDITHVIQCDDDQDDHHGLTKSKLDTVLSWRLLKNGKYECSILLKHPMRNKELKIIGIVVDIVRYIPSYYVECNGVEILTCVLENELERI